MHRTPCALALALVLAAAPALAAGDTIQIVGSAFTLRPILDRWVETFRRAHPETRVRVSAEGQAIVEQAGFVRVPEASVQESLARLR